MEERIMTLHPEEKEEVNISQKKYVVMREAIIESLQEFGELTYGDLRTEVTARLEGSFEGSISWYYTTVKLDLEARHIIKRVGSESPQRIRLASE